MKRLIAFALALAVVFGVSFALYKPERIEAAARETMEDEWVFLCPRALRRQALCDRDRR